MRAQREHRMNEQFEMLRRIRVANVLVEMTRQIFDFHLAFARHWTARFRRRFINADLGVFSLCEELDFVQWCRGLKKPIEDPELQAWREEDLFEGVTKFYNA